MITLTLGNFTIESKVNPGRETGAKLAQKTHCQPREVGRVSSKSMLTGYGEWVKQEVQTSEKIVDGNKILT